MQLHNLKRNTKYKISRRVGRGGKRGTYSGRGVKGQHARAGAKFRPAERELIKKMPKLRGYKFKPFRKDKPVILNLFLIDKNYKEGEVVSPETLFAKGLVKKTAGRFPLIKILGSGELKKKLDFKSVIFSKSVKEKTSRL